MKVFCFTVDDNIRFLKDISNSGAESLFDNPYLALYKRLHCSYGIKVQLNLFYEIEDFNLSDFPDKYKKEWEENSDWLKLSFHAKSGIRRIYEVSNYQQVYSDCQKANLEIVRFASAKNLAKTTTIHYCMLTEEGIKALKDNGIIALLGLYGEGRISYQNSAEELELLRGGELVLDDEMGYSSIDVVINAHSKEENLQKLNELLSRDFIKVMIHEQYFYEDYKNYQADFSEKLDVVFSFLTEKGYRSIFLEEQLEN